MSLQYREKIQLTSENLESELAALGITEPEHIRVIDELVAVKGKATISFYQFSHSPSGPPGNLLVFHDIARAALNFGGNLRWGDWDENFEIITLQSGEKFNFDGKPVYDDDEGACSLGNI